MSSKQQGRTKYGELVLLGYNGQLPQGNRGRKRSKFALLQKPVPNGVKLSKSSIAKASNVLNLQSHSINYTVSKTMTVVSEYERDGSTDMFQIGRSASSAIDFVVIDGHANPEEILNARVTISRFACRIIIDRNEPYTARIYAAGFNDSKNVSLGEAAIKWTKKDGSMDGLTTNGILIVHPRGDFCGGDSSYGCWREVSITGDLYSLRDDRKTRQKGTFIETEDNVLRDGTLINLSGITMLWRSAEGLVKSPDKDDVVELIRDLNDDGPLSSIIPNFPIVINTMMIPRKLTSTKVSIIDPSPYVFIKCGHALCLKEKDMKNMKNLECPACQVQSQPIKLCMGMEPAFYVDYGPPTYAFNPCGHMATEKTIKYWANVEIPHGVSSFIAKCPFCSVPLDGWPGYVKLLFSFVLNGTL